MYEAILKEHGMKNTKSRKAVLQVLQNLAFPATAEEIYEKAREIDALSLSTTYRILSMLAERGIVLKNIRADAKVYYHLQGHRHIHYFVCTNCHHVIPLDECPLEKLENDLTQRMGVQITGHNLELFGICAACRKID